MEKIREQIKENKLDHVYLLYGTEQQVVKIYRNKILKALLGTDSMEELKNDFEDSIFPIHPELKEIKEQLYREGAVYAAMSGSGSTLFGLFREEPVITKDLFLNCRVFTIAL